MIDDDALKRLLRIDDELTKLCKWLNEQRDHHGFGRLIPLVDDLTHILLQAGKNNNLLIFISTSFLLILNPRMSQC
jgi:hypothetical protein